MMKVSNMAQGTQPNHHVTDSANYTKTATTYNKTLGERKKDNSNVEKAKKVAIAVALAAASKNPIVKAGKAIVTATKVAEAANKAKKAADVAKETKTPPAPPSGKTPDLKNPPKVPMGKDKVEKAQYVPERQDRAAVNQNPQPAKKPVTPNGTGTKRGTFSGDVSRYNWTGK